MKKLFSPVEAWAWKMDYCKQRRITPANPWNWDKAELAYADYNLVQRTAELMHERLEVQRVKGYTGWNSSRYTDEDLLERLKKNLDEGDLLDVINLAAILIVRKDG